MLLLSIYVYADTARVSVCQEPTVSPTSQATLTATTVSQSDARRWERWPIISHKSVSLMVEWPIRFQRGKTHLSTPPVMSLAWAALFVCTAGGAVHTSSTDAWPRTRNQRQSFLSAKEKKRVHKSGVLEEIYSVIFWWPVRSHRDYLQMLFDLKFYHYFLLRHLKMYEQCCH